MLRVWDAGLHRELLDLAGHSRGIFATAISSDGQLALSGGADKGLILWPSGAAEFPLIRGASGRSPAVSEDGRMVLFDSLAGSVKQGKRVVTIFDLQAGLPMFCGEVSIASTRENQFVLTRSEDGLEIGTFATAPNGDPKDQSARLRNDGGPIFDSQNGGVTAAVSPDGTIIATGDRDGRVRLWDVKTSREIRWFDRQHPCNGEAADANRVVSIGFSPDGRKLFVGYPGPATEVWDFDRSARLREMDAKLATARTTLRHDAQDPAALLAMGQWYEARGIWNWAADFLARSKVSPDADLAGCFWLAGDAESAMPLLQRLIADKRPIAGYASLLNDLLLVDRSLPRTFKFVGSGSGERRWSRVSLGRWREMLDGVDQADFQSAGRATVAGKAGSLFIRLPIGPFASGPEITTQVFIADDKSQTSWRSDSASVWNASGAIAEVPPLPPHRSTEPASRPVIPSNLSEPSKSVADAEASGDFAGAAAAYEQAAQQEKQAAASLADAVARAGSLRDAGDPAGALKVLNGSDPRVRSAKPVTVLITEIADLQSRASGNCQRGLEALKRNAFGEALADFADSARGGSGEAMLRLGDLYKAGQGVKADESLARTWWLRAAKAGNAEANERLRAEPDAVSPFQPGRS
jgi:WD40 repeat protein